MTLIRILPFLIGDLVPEDNEHWCCFCLFWTICNLACAYEVHPDDPQHLAWMIQTYLEAFTSLYNVQVKPKMHYMLHLPQQMLL